MQDQPALASRFHWLRSALFALFLTATGVVMVLIATDESGDTSCGGG